MPDVLDLAAARAAADAALAHAAGREAHVSVAVVDQLGREVAVLRGDGATWFTPGVARAKACTAAVFGRPSADLAQLKEAHPEVLELAAGQVAFRPTTLPGGLPVHRGGGLIGAVGVSGAAPEADVECAQAACTVLGQASVRG